MTMEVSRKRPLEDDQPAVASKKRVIVTTTSESNSTPVLNGVEVGEGEGLDVSHSRRVCDGAVYRLIEL